METIEALHTVTRAQASVGAQGIEYDEMEYYYSTLYFQNENNNYDGYALAMIMVFVLVFYLSDQLIMCYNNSLHQYLMRK